MAESHLVTYYGHLVTFNNQISIFFFFLRAKFYLHQLSSYKITSQGLLSLTYESARCLLNNKITH